MQTQEHTCLDTTTERKKQKGIQNIVQKTKMEQNYQDDNKNILITID